MLTFASVNRKNLDSVRRAYRYCDYRVSDYSLGTKLMWKPYLHTEVAFSCGCMIIKNRYRGAVRFDYPIPCEETYDLAGALTEIEQYCMAHYIPLMFSDVPEAKVGDLAARYRSVSTASARSEDEYLYLAEDLMRFEGKHYAGQRNHIRRFESAYPDASFKILTPDAYPLLERFIERFSYRSPQKSREAETELKYAFGLLRKFPKWACAGYMEYEGEMIAVSLGEICGDTMILHIEKALYEYEGVYPALVQAFARSFCSGVRYINREEDTGDSGLRRSKMQYRPKTMLRKYEVTIHTELAAWEKIPVLHTERLTLSALGENDRELYNRLCLDDERNRYWGYDYRTDCPDPDEEYFLAETRKDFETKTAVNWAIRSNGKLVGEVLLYDFDYHGGVQVGVRLLSDCEGRGFGGEALCAVLHAALYGLGLSVVRAKCYRENVRSYRMLSAHMERAGEDDTFFYFASGV